MHGGEVGDQTGTEARIRAFYDYPWDVTLHYNGKADFADAPYVVMGKNIRAFAESSLTVRVTRRLARGKTVYVRAVRGKFAQLKKGDWVRLAKIRRK